MASHAVIYANGARCWWDAALFGWDTLFLHADGIRIQTFFRSYL